METLTDSIYKLSQNTELDSLHNQIEACTVCRSSGYNIVKPGRIERGDSNAMVMAIGVAPGKAAQLAGKAFAGNSFMRLATWFAAAGYPGTESQLRRSLYLTSLIKCSVKPDTERQRRGLWARCNTFLWKQIQLVQPSLILLLGREPATLILNQKNPILRDIVGRTFTTDEIFDQQLFPNTDVKAVWLVLPHPSGLSRTMNDQQIAKQVVISLKENLDLIGFRIRDSEDK